MNLSSFPRHPEWYTNEGLDDITRRGRPPAAMRQVPLPTAVADIVKEWADRRISTAQPSPSDKRLVEDNLRLLVGLATGDEYSARGYRVYWTTSPLDNWVQYFGQYLSQKRQLFDTTQERPLPIGGQRAIRAGESFRITQVLTFTSDEEASTWWNLGPKVTDLVGATPLLELNLPPSVKNLVLEGWMRTAVLMHQSGDLFTNTMPWRAQGAIIEQVAQSGASSLVAFSGDLSFSWVPDVPALSAYSCATREVLAYVKGAVDPIAALMAPVMQFTSLLWIYEGLIVVCQKPVAMDVDAENRLHGFKQPAPSHRLQPAVRWPNGDGFAYYHGQFVRPGVALKPLEEITSGNWGYATPVERRVIAERMTSEELFHFLNRIECPFRRLDSDVDGSGQPRSLFLFVETRDGEGVRDDEGVIAIVEVKCPSVGDTHYLRVPPGTKTCAEGVAWTYGMDVSRYKPDIER
jgi:hypothetical protein